MVDDALSTETFQVSGINLFDQGIADTRLDIPYTIFFAQSALIEELESEIILHIRAGNNHNTLLDTDLFHIAAHLFGYPDG